jgi:hypothetical protein
MPIPTKLFDVQNGNDAALDVTYPRATLIAYKDNASKDAIINTIADANGYQVNIPNGSGGTIPNPQSRQNFFNDWLKKFLKDCYRDGKVKLAAASASSTASAAADAELP